MKSKMFRYTSLLVGVLLIAGLFFGAMLNNAAAVTPVKTDGGQNVSAIQAPGWTAATRPWTKAEMLAAKPYPIKGPSADRSMTTTPDVVAGSSGTKPSNLPMDARAQTDIEPDLGVFSAPSPQGYSYPAPFTRYSNFAMYTVFPYVTVGKLFFTQYGTNYVCSAASIGNYAIWTAGHCVHAGDNQFAGWSYNVVFVPAYKNGTAPKGQWSASNLWTNTNWYAYEDLRYDIGGAILYTNASGYKISQVVGNLGFSYGPTVNYHWFQMGYPAAPPFAGTLQIINASSYAYSDGSFGTPYPKCVGNDMTGGSSGGPWILSFKGSAGASNYLNGHNDYRWSGYPKEMCSPHFGDAAYSLWNALVTDTP